MKSRKDNRFNLEIKTPIYYKLIIRKTEFWILFITKATNKLPCIILFENTYKTIYYR